ncbi:unnamed protein product [Colias eurytheme]|nr:unnamed protein product [Colias eurytheme]
MFGYKTVPQTYWFAVFSISCSCLFITECRRIKRVIGGEEVACGTQVRVASLRNSSNSHHLCVATVITPHHAVTAAHCVEETPQSYMLQLNNHCIESQDVPKAQVLEIIKHDLYNPFSYEHDIAVLRVKLNFTDMTSLNGTILPDSSFGISGNCGIYGYGYRDMSVQETSETLQSADVQLVSLDECTMSLGPGLAPNPLGGMLCAMGDGVDACQGDSGGPLICADKVEGLASYGLSCNVPGMPGVYVSIGAHLKWLRSIIY